MRKAAGARGPAGPVEIDRGIEGREIFVQGYRGRMRWATLVLSVYATLFLVGALLVSFMKMWYWQRLNRNTVLREIKRLELRLAELAGRDA